MRSLVDAALLDQERRVLAATPADIDGDGPRRGRHADPSARARCEGGCGKWLYRSALAGRTSYRCHACFPPIRKAKLLDGPRCDRPQCNARRLQRNRWNDSLYCSGRTHHTG